MVRELDPVASRLASAQQSDPALIVQWLEGKQRRTWLRRRAFWCSLSAWLLVTAAAVISSAVAIRFSRETRETFGSVILLNSGWSYEYETISPPMTIEVIPPMLAFVAATFLIGGLIGWLLGRFPGHSWTAGAIDWSNVTDAVWRLLAVGCTYPEAFETAAKVARCSDSRRWLRGASARVQQGAAEVTSGNAGSSGDVLLLETLVMASDWPPSSRWKLAQSHFSGVATRRLALLQATVPIVATLVAGLLIWLSISATLGWMWFSIGRMITGLV